MDTTRGLEFYSSWKIKKKLEFIYIKKTRRQDDGDKLIQNGIHKFIVHLWNKVRRKGWIWYSQGNHHIQNAEISLWLIERCCSF